MVKLASETPEPLKSAPQAAVMTPSSPPAAAAASTPAATVPPKEKPAAKGKESVAAEAAEVLGLDTKNQKSGVKAPWDEIKTDSKK